MRNLIFDTLPITVEIDGNTVPVAWGYRQMILIEIEMFSDNSEAQKLLNALNIFYLGQIPDNRKEAVEKLLWFYRCGEESKRQGGSRRQRKDRAYDFEEDANLFYAAYLQQYGINLRATNNADLHWWEFVALMESLSEQTRLAKVMYWRTADLQGLSKSEKAHIQKMRKIYELKKKETADHRISLAKRNADMKEYLKRRLKECAEELAKKR